MPRNPRRKTNILEYFLRRKWEGKDAVISGRSVGPVAREQNPNAVVYIETHLLINIMSRSFLTSYVV